MAFLTRGRGDSVPQSDAFRQAQREERREGGASEDTQEMVSRLIREAREHYEVELLSNQVEATDYFYGRAFGDEEEGRSKIVSTEVRDAIEAGKPSLLRIFLGTDAPCEFKPRGAEDVELAKQMTEAVQYYIREENDGYLTFDNTFDNALLRRIGYVKAWFEDVDQVSAEKYSGLDAAAAAQVMEDKTAEVLQDTIIESSASTPERPLVDFEVRRKIRKRGLRIVAVPNEELWYSPGFARLDDCTAVVHCREVRASDLIAMGIDEDLVLKHAGKTTREAGAQLFDARQFGATDPRTFAEDTDPYSRMCLFAEAYVIADVDGDKYAERRLFQCVGPEYEIANGDGDGEIISEVPVVGFVSRPLPHMIPGMSVHDQVKDIQRINSQLERGMLNSLALALEPKMGVWDGKVNTGDLLNPDLLNIIRCTGDPNQVIKEIKHQFLGSEVLPVSQYFVEKRMERLGITKASQGLDADALQSSTKQAVAGTFQAAQQRIEMVARSLAETGMKPLYKLIAKLLVRHQDQPLMIRLRGRYVQMDPRSWNAMADVVVNVGLGSGSFDEKLQSLKLVVEDQDSLLAQGSPLVTWEQARASRVKVVELMGFRNVDEFYLPFGPKEAEQYAKAQEQAKQGEASSDPTMALAQVEREKAQMNMQIAQMKAQLSMQVAQAKLQIEQQSAQSKLQIEQQKFQLEELKVRLQDDREREKIARDAVLKEYELELTHALEIDDAALQAKVAGDRASMDEEGGNVKAAAAALHTEMMGGGNA
jgi:hypothetical protein